MSNIEKWKAALNWNLMPEFKSIHGLPEERFVGCYYCPETVNELVDKIRGSIINGYGFNHKTILGDPGVGKTTFIYYLRNSLQRSVHGEIFHMEILHLQRLVTATSDAHRVIEERTLNILKNYFHANKFQAEHEEITRDSKDSKISINKLEDFLIANKSQFSKRLIIVIDDVDETPEDTVNDVLRYFYSLLECEQVSKWLIARATTLNHYSEKLVGFIETKFPQRLAFPKVDLYGVINKRIMHDNPNGLNPFIPELCHHLLAAHNNDLRISVANAITFLEDLPPPTVSKKSQEFIGQYFLTNFTKIMTQIGIFPDIYHASISRTFPVEKDVFLVLASKNRFDSGNIVALGNHYKEVYSSIHNGHYSEESYLINLNKDHIDQAIFFLKNNRLIVEHSRIKGFFQLTTKGESFVRFVNENIYTQYAKKRSTDSLEPKHPVFWDLAEMQPEYEVEVRRIRATPTLQKSPKVQK